MSAAITSAVVAREGGSFISPATTSRTSTRWIDGKEQHRSPLLPRRSSRGTQHPGDPRFHRIGPRDLCPHGMPAESLPNLPLCREAGLDRFEARGERGDLVLPLNSNRNLGRTKPFNKPFLIFNNGDRSARYVGRYADLGTGARWQSVRAEHHLLMDGLTWLRKSSR